MSSLLPPKSRLKINYKNVTAVADAMAKAELSVLLICEKSAKTLLKQCQRSPELLCEYERLNRLGPVAALRLNAHDSGGTVLCIFVKKQLSTHERLHSAAKACKEITSLAASTICLATLGLDQDHRIAWLNAQLAALLAASAKLPSYKQKSSVSPLASITVVGATASDLHTTLATQQGNDLARWFTALPPNLLNCDSYRRTLETLAAQQGWHSEFLGVTQLKARKAGAFLAVARANTQTGAGILHLRYQPKKARARQSHSIALVGKGICFDTGGINLKSHRSMYDMHTDMQGSAVAVGTLLALTQLNVPYQVDCWLALTENEIGPNAYRPQEVVTAANGLTIQVVHSDAEGRMALADTLWLATRAQPNLVIDFATLTGACVQALTERYSGAFSNRPDLRDAIEQAGHASGERVWSFPMDSDYDADLESPIADLMQCTLDNKGDHILAARFLSKFVPENIPWIHIDLSSATRTGGLGHVSSEITGFGVRWAVQFLQSHSLKS